MHKYLAANPQVSSSRLQQDFKLCRLLGQGGFGAVIHCRNKLDRKDYAVKIMFNVIDDREIQNLSKLPTHENLVQYHTAWKDSFSSGELAQIITKMEIHGMSIPKGSSTLNLLCIQMELCGQDLRSWLDQGKLVGERISFEIFLQLLEGLNHIHTNNLIHRDLKPDNIFFDKNDPSRVKIGDLGIATDHYAPKARQHTAGAGTMLYLAPEQAQASYSKSVDIYALGIIFMELLCPSLQRDDQKLVEAINALKYKKIVPDSITRKWSKAAGLIVQMVAVDSRERPTYESICTAFPAWSSFLERTPIVSEPQNHVVHSGVDCDGCGIKNIQGVRFKCTTCSDYDLCENCEKKHGLHPQDHILLKIKTSRGRIPDNFGPHAAASSSKVNAASNEYYKIPVRYNNQQDPKFEKRGIPLPPNYGNPFQPKPDPISDPFHRLLNLNSVGQTRTPFDTNSPDSSSAEEAGDEYLTGIVCNNCDRKVTTWYQCDNCPKRYPGGFDLCVCRDCYRHNSFLEHIRRHSFTKFRT